MCMSRTHPGILIWSGFSRAKWLYSRWFIIPLESGFKDKQISLTKLVENEMHILTKHFKLHAIAGVLSLAKQHFKLFRAN